MTDKLPYRHSDAGILALSVPYQINQFREAVSGHNRGRGVYHRHRLCSAPETSNTGAAVTRPRHFRVDADIPPRPRVARDLFKLAG